MCPRGAVDLSAIQVVSLRVLKLSGRHEEKLRFLIVGGWNTVLGYLLFVALFGLLGGVIHYAVILTLGYFVGITQAYFCYKFLVFKTKGNYLREYLRFYLVYASAFLINLALLPVSVEILGVSPIVSQGVIVLITVIISYVGHKNFSFSVGPAWPEDIGGSLPRKTAEETGEQAFTEFTEERRGSATPDQ